MEIAQDIAHVQQVCWLHGEPGDHEKPHVLFRRLGLRTLILMIGLLQSGTSETSSGFLNLLLVLIRICRGIVFCESSAERSAVCVCASQCHIFVDG